MFPGIVQVLGIVAWKAGCSLKLTNSAYQDLLLGLSPRETLHDETRILSCGPINRKGTNRSLRNSSVDLFGGYIDPKQSGARNHIPLLQNKPVESCLVPLVKSSQDPRVICKEQQTASHFWGGWDWGLQLLPHFQWWNELTTATFLYIFLYMREFSSTIFEEIASSTRACISLITYVLVSFHCLKCRKSISSYTSLICVKN